MKARLLLRHAVRDSLLAFEFLRDAANLLQRFNGDVGVLGAQFASEKNICTEPRLKFFAEYEVRQALGIYLEYFEFNVV